MFEHFTGGRPNYQRVLNDLGARSRPELRKIPVRARIVWERDGEEWVSGNALRLDPGVAIFVEFTDKRCKFTGAWLSPDDVSWPGKPSAGDTPLTRLDKA